MKEKLVLRKEIKKVLNKLLLSIIIFLIGMILVKAKPNLKETLKTKLYEESLPFQKLKTTYNKYLGNIIEVEETQPVFNETLSYNNISKYKDGVKLEVSSNYMVPILESGVVVFIGEKENYKNTIIVEQTNGIDVFYGNIKSNNIKLYDYVEKGELLGEANSELYLVFQKDGAYLDYKEYI